MIATGARPSESLPGLMQLELVAVREQIQACRAVGLRRVVLVHLSDDNQVEGSRRSG